MLKKLILITYQLPQLDLPLKSIWQASSQKGVNFSARPITVIFRYCRIKSILNNLLTNAIKYAVPESLIEFKVEALRQGDQSEVVFTVSNEVVPESAPNPEMVFQRYYRAEMAKQQSGAGLGLWLAQSMAHALDTSIHYVNQQNTVTFHFAIRV